MANLRPINIPASFWNPQEFMRATKDGRAKKILSEIIDKIDELNRAVERTSALKEVDSLLIKTRADREAAAHALKNAEGRGKAALAKAREDAKTLVEGAAEKVVTLQKAAMEDRDAAERERSLAAAWSVALEKQKAEIDATHQRQEARQRSLTAREASLAHRLAVLETALREAAKG
jgi:hypothetical protein